MALVRKIDPEWKPSENPDLQVGDVIEMSDAKSLVLAGVAELVDENGNKVSTYAAYGEFTDREREEFENWVQMKEMKRKDEIIRQENEALRKGIEQNKKDYGTGTTSSSETDQEQKNPEYEAKAKRLAALEKARKVRQERLKNKKK